MKFRSMDELRNHIIKHSEVAIAQAQEEVYGLLYKYLQKYYSEYDPIAYERTYQLLRSLVKTKIVRTASGWKTEVYYDLSSLDYSFKLFMKPEYHSKKYGYRNPFNPKHTSQSGRFAHPTGDPQQVMEAAARGEHGGKVVGTAIWTDPIVQLQSGKMREIFRKWLTSNGIPVR